MEIGNVKGINIISEREQYVGDVASDDFDSMEYKLFIEKDARSTIVMPVTLRFKDATNKEFVETNALVLRIYSQREAQNLGLVEKPNFVWYFVIGFLILIYVLYRILKKRKRKLNNRG